MNQFSCQELRMSLAEFKKNFLYEHMQRLHEEICGLAPREEDNEPTA